MHCDEAFARSMRPLSACEDWPRTRKRVDSRREAEIVEQDCRLTAGTDSSVIERRASEPRLERQPAAIATKSARLIRSILQSNPCLASASGVFIWNLQRRPV